MAVHPDYFISGIWKSKDKRLTHFFVHKNMEGGFRKGEIKSEKEVLRLLDSAFTIATLTWSYEAGKWIDGAEVKMVEYNNERTVRSFKDHQQTDHLDKLDQHGAGNGYTIEIILLDKRFQGIALYRYCLGNGYQ